MKTIAIIFSVDELPFRLNLANISAAIDERMRIHGPAGYLGSLRFVFAKEVIG